MKLSRILLLSLLAASGLCQEESTPYFALYTTRTFGSGVTPQVGLSAWNVDSLEFRIYRVNDPLKFFQQLDSPHEFGGAAPKPPKTRTLLERIHSWKRGMRAGIRRGLRGQFTESPSAHFTSGGAAAVPATKGTQYAEAPILNPQQLVYTFNQSIRSHSRWERQNVDIPIKDRGVYLVEAVRGELRAYTIVMVSDLVLITKTGTGRIVNFVADRNTGNPLRGVQLSLLGREGGKAAAETNADGIAEIPFTETRPGDLRLIAHRGPDVAVNPLANYAFRNSWESWMGYLYTDRPVYRPGHTVHFKAIVRVKTPDGYSIPAGKKLTVEINDPEQKTVYKKELTVSATGALHDDLLLAPNAPLGTYFTNIHSVTANGGGDGDEGEGYMNGSFDVEEYKKPEYEVRVLPSITRVLQGQSVQAVIDTRYYFGEPVANAQVKYAVYRSRYWFPMWYDPDDDDMSTQIEEGGDSYGDEQVVEEEGKLDADGKLTIKFDTTVSDQHQDARYRIEARVTDAGQREISGRNSVIATYGPYVVNVRPDRYFYKPGTRAQFTFEARDYDQKPVRAKIHAELSRWSMRDHALVGTGSTADVETGPQGLATTELTIPSEGGSYRITLTSQSGDRTIEDHSYLWVSGRGAWDWGGESNRRSVQIVPDKKTYSPGETAKILVITGQPNTSVLVSVEGRDLRWHKVLHSAEPTTSFDIPVAATQEPGFWVAASFVRKGNLYQETKYVRVPPVDHQLNIAVTTNKPQYIPGETAQYTLQVSDAAGKPVPRAELSLGVVDEAIYAIRRDMTDDPLKYFFGKQWNSVFTEDSLNYYFSGSAGKRKMLLANVRPSSRLAQLKPERLVQPKIRKAFPDTAFWAPDLTTDANGRALAKVEFPDSLTTWRATARGVTPDTKVGAATMKTIVRKNLIVRLAVPRFFVQGDEITISAIVHNYLANAKTARISVDVKGLDILDGATRDVQILPRAEVKLDWRVRAQQVRSATITGKALTDEESDALELELPVNIPGVKLTEARGGAIPAGSSTGFDMTFPAKIHPGSRELSIRISPSIAGGLFGALEYLITFPYGCVEQTMSSFLPNVLVTRAVNELGIKADLGKLEADKKMRAGLDRLYTFQHEDGGWGWWETDESHPFMTAYVVAGLVQAKAAGVQVDEDRINRGAQWVRDSLARNNKLAPDLRAYMVYARVLAGDKKDPALTDVFDKRSTLSPYGLALLGLALEAAADSRAPEVAGLIEKTASQHGEQAFWPATRDPLLDFDTDAAPEATAFAVKFLSHQRPDSPLLAKAALWLMTHRNEGYWWNSTKQTAMVIYGLTDYLKAAGELNPNLTATVYVNDKAVLTKKLDQSSVLGVPELIIPDDKLEPGANRIRVTSSGQQGRLYYSVHADSFSTEDKMIRIGSATLNVQRDYFKLVSKKEGDAIVWDMQPLSGPAALGDTLAVRLQVSGADSKYLMLEDPIPAGTEFITRDNDYNIRSIKNGWQYYASRREFRDDHLAMFQTWFPRGQQEYMYLLKVTNAGAFQISPARVAPMYQHGTMATSEPRRLEVK
jgi:uncharacterized protein YfaS (alpha-2-macroglobulin family)